MRCLLESGVYKRAAFILKIRIKENEIICQFKTIKSVHFGHVHS